MSRLRSPATETKIPVIERASTFEYKAFSGAGSAPIERLFTETAAQESS
jgi:hypothetical protein